MNLSYSHLKKYFFVATACCLVNASCTNQETKKSETPTSTTKNKPTPKIAAPQFNADSAYIFIEKQVSFGPRVPSTKAHEACATYLQNKFKQIGCDVVLQTANQRTFDGKNHTLKNIIASINKDAPNRILLCAHWDTRPFADRDVSRKNEPIDGANDGASGVGVLLEIARVLAQTNSKLGVDFVLFDIEDYGQPNESNFPRQENSWCLGSQYWAANPHKPGYYAQYGILLDMVGAADATFCKEGNSEYYAPQVVNKIWNTASELGYTKYFIEARSGPITDDHLFVNKILAIPTADIIHMSPQTGDFGSFHHTHNDNMNVIDRKTLKAVGQTVLEVLYN
ncbi:MAG: M28 family peptidase [Bacteroidetes bacterium]|nr:M28 family peptidase [Bacteroidota bacterium]